MNRQHVQTALANARRLVCKFGTNALTRPDSSIALSRIFSFVESLADLRKQGRDIIIVTSGAVGLGAQRLGFKEKPDSTVLKQACAAIGQARLMALYEEGFEKFGIPTAQVLLTEDDFSNRRKYLNLRNTVNKLLELGVIPIFNENDVVSTNELETLNQEGVRVCFGDNDKLSALIMSKLEADLLLILSDIDGLFDADPREHPEAKLIPIVEAITPEIEALAGGASKKGRGGMKTKLEAAQVATRSGGMAVIANGSVPGILARVLAGEPCCTVFLPTESLSSRKRWIGFATSVTGQIHVNPGAKKALVEKKTSLLAIGMTTVKNSFEKGDPVGIFDESGKEFARGIVNYSADECRKIVGKHSSEYAAILGYSYAPEIMSRDVIVLL